MYKLLIVDDNEWDRLGIQRVIDWKGMDIEIIGSCANGKQALECVEKEKPDIVLADIAMPVMSGVEMAAELKSRFPDVKIIFMSCYNDFTFARSAIFLDVQDYVLKPIVKDDLRRALLKVLNKYEVENTAKKEKEEMMKNLIKTLPVLREKFLRELFFGSMEDMEDIYSRLSFLGLDCLKDAGIHVVSLEIGDYGKIIHGMGADDKYLTSDAVQRIIDSQSRAGCQILNVQISSKEFAFIVLDKTNHETGISSELMEILLGIEEEISRRLCLETVIGVSKCSDRLSDIAILYRQSKEALKTNFFSGKNQVVLYSEIEEAQQYLFEETVNLQALYKEIKNILSIGSEEDIPLFLEKYLKHHDTSGMEYYLQSFAFTVANAIQIILIETGGSFRDIFDNDLVIWNKLLRFNTVKDAGQWLFSILKSAREYLLGRNKSQDHKIVHQIKEVIHSRYYEQLTVNDILKGIYISPSYANAIFKKVTGKTIFDYLTEYRIEESKKLLKDTNNKVYLVAEQVGYTNIAHFRLVFKKHVGIGPAEFKDRAVF